MAQSNVVAFRWRTSATAPPAQWKRGAHEWTSGTLADLRRALAPTCGSAAELAADYDPSLWVSDRNGNVAPEPEDIAADVLLSWTPTTCTGELFTRHANGRPRAVLLFTFPPAEATEHAAKRARAEAPVVPGFNWDTMRDNAREFFALLSDPATLQPDANGFLYLPQHPSMAMSNRRRFDFIETPGEPTKVPLLSRALAREYMQAMMEQCEDPHNDLYIHGAQGVGKSYALYEAVCRLMARPDTVRVVYFHDCSGWSRDQNTAIQQLAAAAASGFHPKREAQVWTAAMAVRDYIELDHLLGAVLPNYCRERGLRLIAIFDQHHGLDPELRKQLPWSMPERDLPAFASWKGLAATVISASANNEYYLKAAVDAKWRRHDCYHGFKDAERDQWRRHHRFFDGPQYASEWEDVKALLDNWPLDLDEMRKAPQTTLAATLEKHRQERMLAMEDLEAAHLRANVTTPNEINAYYRIILDMLIGRGAVVLRYPNAQRLLNKHILYYRTEDHSVQPIHDLARQFYLTRGYHKRAGAIMDATVKEVLSSKVATDDAKG